MIHDDMAHCLVCEALLIVDEDSRMLFAKVSVDKLTRGIVSFCSIINNLS